MNSAIANPEQSKQWNGASGAAWVAGQPMLDRMFQPFEEFLAAEVAKHSGTHILDVGCGTGATTLAVARAGTAVGIDISEPMLEVARARAAERNVPARFLCADAQTYCFEPDGFDIVVSRFGVMFFDGPVAAFANLLAATRPGGRLCVLAWRSEADNPFMTAAARAAAPLLPAFAPRKQDAPGQFAFADVVRVRGILEAAGWAEIEIEALDLECSLPAEHLPSYAARMGPVGAALREAEEETRARVVEALRDAFAPFVEGAEARFVSACWVIRGRAGSDRKVLPRTFPRRTDQGRESLRRPEQGDHLRSPGNEQTRTMELK